MNSFIKKKVIISNIFVTQVLKFSVSEPLKKTWNVLFFGTDDFALQSLVLLNYNRQKILGQLEVVVPSSSKEYAVLNYANLQNIKVHFWPYKGVTNQFDIGIVVSFGHLIPESLITAFPFGIINVHGSLLPKWRGAAPLSHAIINGDTYTGASIMRIMPQKFDIGSVIAQEKIKISKHETLPDLYKKVANIGANLLIKVLKEMPQCLESAVPQNDLEASYAPKITKKISFIKWNIMNATDIYNLERGIIGIEPLRTFFKGKIVKLLNVTVVDNLKLSRTKIPGQAFFDKKNRKVYIYCQGDTWISVGTFIVPGRKPLDPQSFGSGYISNQSEKTCIFY